MNFKVPSHVKTTATSIWCTTEIEKNTKNKNKINTETGRKNNTGR
jgi:hypothetical protein